MADGTMGWTAQKYDDTWWGTGKTTIGIIAAAQATIDGKLYKFDIYIQNADTSCTVRVFRDDGTYYRYIGGETFSLSGGLNSGKLFTAPISVKKGDMIAYYCSGGGNVSVASLTGGCVYRGANVTTDSLKTDWSAVNYKMALKGYIQPVAKGIKAIGNPMIF